MDAISLLQFLALGAAWFLVRFLAARLWNIPRLPSKREVRVERVWVEQPEVVGRRRGIKVLAEVTAHRARGVRLDYRVRFRRRPVPIAVRARASRYYGPEGELVARASTRPVVHPVARYPSLWVFVPYGAFELPRGRHDLEVQFDVEIDGQWQAGGRAAIRFEQPEEAPGGDSSPVGDEDFELLEASAGGPADCPLCNEPVLDAVHACPRCETVHHRDCWEYNGGCTTYACPGEA